MCSMCVLGAKLEGAVRGFPPHVKSRKVLVRSLQQASVRHANLEARLGEEHYSSAPTRALCVELRICAGGREIRSVVDGEFWRRHCGTPQHAPNAGIRTHGAERA